MIAHQTALNGITRLAIDTSPFIYLIERNARYLPLVHAIFAQIDAGRLEGYSSIITITEVQTGPKKRALPEIERRYNEILLNSEHIALINVDAAIADTAAALRARYNLRTPDAIRLAMALAANCEAFVTNDRGLRRVTELRVIALDDLLPIPE